MQPAGRIALQPWMTEPATQEVMAALNREGGTARFVGGAVRDALLGRAVSDVDLATDLKPEAVTQRLEAAGVTVVPTGLAHGTVTAVAKGRHFEITTLRHDVETFGRRATVAFGADWAADAARRDFTMNALYLDADGTLYDPTGGRPDLEAGRVRFVGDPATRIAEDYLRVLRFFRFQAQLGRAAPDPPGLAACAAAAAKLATLSAERIRVELLKLLAVTNPTPTVLTMVTHGILSPIVGTAGEPDRLAATVAAEQALGQPAEPLRRLVALLPGVPAPELAQHLRLSNAEAERLIAMLAPGPLPQPDLALQAIHAEIYRHGAVRFVDRTVLAAAATDAPVRFAPLLAEAERFTPPRLPIAGRDLVAMGVPKGPDVGRLLRAAEEVWIAGDFRAGRNELLAWVRAQR